MDQVAGEAAAQTWQAQTGSEGLLGTPGGGTRQAGLQLPPPGAVGDIESEWAMFPSAIVEAATIVAARSLVLVVTVTPKPNGGHQR